MTLAELKQRLFAITGIDAADQTLILYASNDEHADCLGELRDDKASLASQGLAHADMRVHVRDKSGKSGAFEITDNSAPKYVMAEDVYDARNNTYRAYKKAMAAVNPPPPKKTAADYPHIALGKRCLVETGHRGEVAFFGEIAGKKGLFVGVRLDDPFGLNDGTADGKRLFEALPKCGVFVRPDKIQVGDYPKEEEESE
jgi:tubulin-folding cofactor B